MILLLFQYILKQKEDSMMFNMLQAQLSNQIKTSFNETANNILFEFNISHSITDIKDIKIGVFKSIVKKKCIKASPEYLVNKQSAGRKRKYIRYFSLSMAEYLLPQAGIGLEDQQELFSTRCRTNRIGTNRGKKYFCYTQCGEILNNSHIFQCNVLNRNVEKYDIDKIFNGFNSEKMQNLKKVEGKHDKTE